MKISINHKYMILQGLFWMLYCVATGFVSLFLLERGFDNKSIGVVTAVFCTVSAFLQPVLGRVCDSNPKLSWKIMILILSVPFFASCVLMVIVPGKAAGAVLIGMLLLLINTIMPFINTALSYYESVGERINFGVARGIGSGAFALLSLIIGYIADIHGAKTVPLCGIAVVALFVIVTLNMPYNANYGRKINTGNTDIGSETSNSIEFNNINSSSIDPNTANLNSTEFINTDFDNTNHSIEDPGNTDISNEASNTTVSGNDNVYSVASGTTNNTAANAKAVNNTSKSGFLRKYPGFIIMFVAFIFLASSHNVDLLYLLQVIQSLGGNSRQYGTAIAIMAVFEVPMLFCFSLIIRRFNARTLMLVSAAGYGIKALSFALCRSVTAIYFAESAQMISFALFASASVYYTVEMIGEEDQGTGQALMTSTMTLGSVLGSLIGGLLLDMCGVRRMLTINVVIALAGIILAIISYKTNHERNTQSAHL